MVAAGLKRFRPRRERQRWPSGRGADEPLLSAELMGSLQRLNIHAPTVQQGTFAGEHRSRRHGSSPEFADYRRYSPGDDIRRVDWNLYARFDELFVRLSEVTTDLAVHMLVDSSASMDWHSAESLPTKHRFARQLAAALGYAALWHFDQIRVAPFGFGHAQPMRPAQGRSRIPEMLAYLEAVRPEGGSSLAERLQSHGHRDPVAGLIVVFSDLLSEEPDVLGMALRQLRGRGWEVAMIHILDPAERDPDLLFPRTNRTGEPTTLIDAELGTRVMMNPSESALTHYRGQFTAWEAGIREICRRQGVQLIPVETTQPIVDVVLSLLNDYRLLR